MTLDRPALWRLAPRARAVYRETFTRQDADATLAAVGLDTPIRLAHFLAQCLQETGGFVRCTESLAYTTPERLMTVWPSRFPTVESATPFLNDPQKLANLVYGGRMGNIAPGDGWKFIGRGLLQLTGRARYRTIGSAIGVDLVAEPALVLAPEHALAVACAVWQAAAGNEPADRDDLEAVTRRINGGTTGLALRALWLVQTRRLCSS